MFSQKILFPKWSPLQEQLQPKCHLYWSLHLSAYIVSLVASFVAQLVKNLPALQETWVRSLGWEDPLEKVKATHSSILAWRIPWTVQFLEFSRILKWIAFPSSRGSSQPRDRTQVSLIAGRFFTSWTMRRPDSNIIWQLCLKSEATFIFILFCTIFVFQSKPIWWFWSPNVDDKYRAD